MKKYQNTLIFSILPAMILNILYIHLIIEYKNISDYFIMIIAFLSLITISYFAYKNKKQLNIPILIMKMIFYIYVFQLFYLLFLSPYYQRDIKLIINNNYLQSLAYHLQYDTNLIPFQTIKRMLTLCYYDQYRYFAIINLLGNLLAFAFFGLFIPILYPKFRKTYRFVFLIGAIIFFVEIFQFLTLCGSMDIDDFILNFFGALLLYYPINAFIHYLKK